jgi:hypothetical protein
MNPLAESEAVALLLQHAAGWVHVYADGSSRWSTAKPDPSKYWDPSDVPESIACERRSYGQARLAFSQALKRLRARGIQVG